MRNARLSVQTAWLLLACTLCGLPNEALPADGDPGQKWAVLIAVNVVNLWGPPPGSKVALAVAALGAYFGFAAIAYWLDRARVAPLVGRSE